MDFIYTPQQQAGYKGYSGKVKVGNWSEDLALDETKLKDFLYKRERGQLRCTQQEKRFAHALQQTTLFSRHTDGNVHFGDIIMLFNQATDGCLACDMHEKLSDETFSAQTTWYTEPCARTTFEVVPYQGRGDKRDAIFAYNDDTLHFSQKFRLRCHVQLTEQDAFLSSHPKTPSCFARYSRHQEVVFTHTVDWSTVFECVCLDPQFRMEMEGQPVAANVPLAIMHCSTNQFLASDNVKFRNDFGSEYEIFCHNYVDGQRGQLGTRHRRGLGEQNRWCFVNTMPQFDEQGAPVVATQGAGGGAAGTTATAAQQRASGGGGAGGTRGVGEDARTAQQQRDDEEYEREVEEYRLHQEQQQHQQQQQQQQRSQQQQSQRPSRGGQRD